MKVSEKWFDQRLMLWVALLVHRFNGARLHDKYLQNMVTCFCEINWPIFITLREKNHKVTASSFLKTYASKYPVIQAIENEESGVLLIPKSELSYKGTLTSAYEKVMGSHNELKRGYDFLVEDSDVLELLPIQKYESSDMIPALERFIS
jgi:hypothetical protein